VKQFLRLERTLRIQQHYDLATLADGEFHSRKHERLLFSRQRLEISFGVKLVVLGCGLDVRHQTHVMMVSDGHGMQPALAT